MSTTWKRLLRTEIDSAATTGHIEPTALVARFLGEHAEDLKEDMEGMMRREAMREVQSYFSSARFEPPQQLIFEGMDLPHFIAVRHRGRETTFIKTELATFADLLAGELERIENVANARAKLLAYQESVERLRPIMKGNPTMTVAQAIHILAEQSEAA